MRIITFAAIDIGSYELSMKIFEMSEKYGMKEIDFIRYRLDLGRDTYATGKISCDMMNELCDKLMDFKKVMKEYKVQVYRVCTTSAIRETVNTSLVLDQIHSRTGIEVEILSNSEQRFLGYKSIASQKVHFNKMIRRGTAIADIGGGSLQISLFDKDSLVTTQNMRLGTLRISEKLADLEYRSIKYTSLVEELIENELRNFEKLYVKDQNIQNIIAVGDFIYRIVTKLDDLQSNSITREQFMTFYNNNSLKSPEWIAENLGIAKEYSSLIVPTLILFKGILERTKAETIWAPGTYLCDGIAYDYAVEKKYIKEQHDFEKDILAASKNIAKRYLCNKEHIRLVSKCALTIFDAMKKIHGMGKRERLLLEIVTMLHDCGTYISMSNAAECSYNIIMSTEIIGLSHMEREIVASTVLYNTIEIPRADDLSRKLNEQAYLTVCKLAAILKISNVLDRSHKQKIQNITASLKDRILWITVDAAEDITLEYGLFDAKAIYFEEVFCIKSKLKIRKSYSE